MTDEQCPVCGYYCLGNGGVDCIDKPQLCKQVVQDSRDAEVAFLQSRIDELMLEYCPNEMTREQLDNYAAHQRPVSESELPEAIRARGDTK